MKKNLLFLLLITAFTSKAQQAGNSLSLLFLGDIMGHSPQIDGAYNRQTQSYDYLPVFDKVKHHFARVDFTIGNLEVTLAGKPYKGYPRFSSPDALAVACLQSGIDALVTANNHSCDGGKVGITRTLQVLDSLGIARTGTFTDEADREKNNLLVLEKNGIRIGILNYTYGTNGLPVPEPTIVNRIDYPTMRADIQKAKQQQLDKLIVMIHWGVEYQLQQSEKQETIAAFLFDNGVDVIVGGHPHVVQPMEFRPATSLHKERFVAYSLGNFVSNQRKPNCDGGAMLELTFFKDAESTRLNSYGYHLVWVHKYPKESSKHFHFEVLPCKEYEQQGFPSLSEKSRDEMQLFIGNARNVLESYFVKELE
ncbi:CapA family protein [Capnocytophaga sp.]|uniref:CapA family protein n=1 Tax=Capnocytophaga sp. TaxID=44737 RepID=UPI0026DD0A05|nr:CapA family protein [Capnocytophaga sp.]MDO5106376.1 CapA family protein [Capnocytophaga sp.]